MSALPVFISIGALKVIQPLLLKWLLVLSCLALMADSNALSPSRPPSATMVVRDLPLPANLHGQKHLPSHSGPIPTPSPTHPPLYSPSLSTGYPPASLHSSNPFMKDSELGPHASGFGDMAPMHSTAGAIPSGLAQPPLSPSVSNCCKQNMVLKRGSKSCHCVYPIKLDLLLLNVSQNSNWNLFLDELATQLELQISQIELVNFYVLSLSALNISMDITPHKGTSFSANEASRINSSLSMHKIQLDPRLVGDYKLLNLTWYEPPPPSQAPTSVASPMKAPIYHKPATSTASASNRRGHSSLYAILGIGAGILFIAITSVLVLCLCRLRPKTKGPSIDTEKPRTEGAVSAAGSFPHPTSTRFIAYEELKEATNNFEAASLLGEGGFGRVFKGVLNDGTTVAIKRLTNGGQQGDKEFLVEVEMLSRLHHRNLVKLVGYYSNRDSSQNLLCYELVPNGSLEAWLHGPLGINCPLDWDTRMKIALDAARGLAYLHEDSQPCVIHRDFKASNILLENNFHAKVADFGLAKQAPEGRANYLSTRVMGTFGYVAPEYAMTGHLLVKSDVYSYGVVLLELLTGRKPVDMAQPAGQENLVTWARPILRDKDRLEELADPRLGGKYPKEDFVRVCTIAAACVAPEASQRPTMGEVVQSLKMVQRMTEYQYSMVASSNTRTNLRQSSTTFESDGTSSMFSSGAYSGLSVFDNDNVSRTAVFSEDLHEGR
ncbi:proline-rich receptor-like protein kinase PERK3 isoform X1 [Prosopis cineraria]|uniref:proline-rich receptor-like protein kinase PERK3 isoform X1 n=2 Tax=Prosopis cineraria TaxID=364024 RepID=UPI0024101C7F|nr:proline-rich receptor-like protein kinase PERK3 isoform X1 [Prosopis cineraria]XP_054802038.1 proline-rich receptor-like protein kinase PERK3 isoform X1 [Prosopis cineraria]